MTPEDRAANLWIEHGKDACLGAGYVQEAIAQAIREAVAEERERLKRWEKINYPDRFGCRQHRIIHEEPK